MRSLGVEEELLLVDADTLVPVAVAETLLRVADDEGMELTAELQQQQIEVDTAPTRDLGELDDLVRELGARESVSCDALGGFRKIALQSAHLPGIRLEVRHWGEILR